MLADVEEIKKESSLESVDNAKDMTVSNCHFCEDISLYRSDIHHEEFNQHQLHEIEEQYIYQKGKHQHQHQQQEQNSSDQMHEQAIQNQVLSPETKHTKRQDRNIDNDDFDEFYLDRHHEQKNKGAYNKVGHSCEDDHPSEIPNFSTKAVEDTFSVGADDSNIEQASSEVIATANKSKRSNPIKSEATIANFNNAQQPISRADHNFAELNSRASFTTSSATAICPASEGNGMLTQQTGVDSSLSINFSVLENGIDNNNSSLNNTNRNKPIYDKTVAAAMQPALASPILGYGL